MVEKELDLIEEIPYEDLHSSGAKLLDAKLRESD